MKAAILRAPGYLMLEEIPKPICPEGGLVVKTQACSICSADVRMFQRGHPALAYPRILGHEVSGVVIESCNSTHRFKTGDRVQIFPGICCSKCTACRQGFDNLCEHIAIMGFTHDGGFAEFVVVPPQSIASGGVNLIPEGLAYEEASLAEPLACCLNGQQLAALSEGDTVLILGAGPIGLLHAMLARAKGASKVLVTERLPSRLKAAGQTHVDRVIDIERENVEMVLLEETGGRGVDIILVACSEVNVSSLPKLLAPKGRFCLFSGLLPKSTQILFDTNLIHYRELTIVGAYGSTAVQNTAALQLMASDEVPITWLITKRLSLCEIQRGIEYVAKREGLKAVISFP